MTDQTQPPAAEGPWDKVVGRIHAKRVPAENMFRDSVGYADLAAAGVIFMFPKGAPPRVFLPRISDEVTTEQLLMVREFLSAEIAKRLNFSKLPTPPPKRNA